MVRGLESRHSYSRFCSVFEVSVTQACKIGLRGVQSFFVWAQRLLRSTSDLGCDPSVFEVRVVTGDPVLATPALTVLNGASHGVDT